MNDIVLILIGAVMGSFGFLLLLALGGKAKLDDVGRQTLVLLSKRIKELEAENAALKAKLDDVGRQTLVLLSKRIKELEAENAALKAKLKPIETVDEWGKPDWVGKETRK